MLRLYLTFTYTLVFAFLLVSCADRHAPAPVEKVYRGKSIHHYKKGSLKQSQYVVKKGDTLYSIAFQANLDYKKLARYNAISAPYTLKIGQKLSLKLAKNQSQDTKSYKNKTVKSKKSNAEVKKAIVKPKSKEYGQKRKQSDSNQHKPASKHSKIIWQWPVNGLILAKFSHKELGNKGLDIGGKRGDKINAAAAGKVVYAGDALRGYGKLIIIKHSDDYLSAYAHNDVIRVKEQQWIKAGQHIADMGKTGSNRVKLHFEVRYRGNTLDPLKFLPKR